jgi:pyruvate carboxylase subunit B
MRYFVTVGERTLEVELTAEGAILEGNARRVELRPVAGSALHHLLVDGNSHTLTARGDGGGTWEVRLDGIRHEVSVVDARARAIREMTGRDSRPQGPRPVRAPMPGMVVRVEVEPGQRVAPGQGVVIVEAMKMENELKADGGGIVSRVHVSAGQPVEKGLVLIEFEVEEARAGVAESRDE